MEKFLFIPPVNDSLGSLKPGQWAWLTVSFLVSLALWALFCLAVANHFLFAMLVICSLSVTTLPMHVYAMNRKGRLVGRIYYAIILGFVLYFGWNIIEGQFRRFPFILIMLIAICGWAYWFTLETAKVNEQFLKRLDELRNNFNENMSALENLIKKQEKAEDSISFDLPAPAKYGWDTIHVYPAEKRCERSVGYGGPPTFHEIIEYDLRPQHRPEAVFARLVDMWKEDLSETSYQVINGTFLESAEEDGSLGNLEKRRLTWYELRGPEMYVILSAHGRDKAFFRQKRRSIEKALTQLEARAEALGAVQVEGFGGAIRYEAPPGADEVQKLAIETGIAILVSEKILNKYGFIPNELLNEDYAYVLDKLADEKPEGLVLGEEDKAMGEVS